LSKFCLNFSLKKRKKEKLSAKFQHFASLLIHDFNLFQQSFQALKSENHFSLRRNIFPQLERKESPTGEDILPPLPPGALKA